MKRSIITLFFLIVPVFALLAKDIQHEYLPDGCHYQNGHIVYPAEYNKQKTVIPDKNSDYKYVIFTNFDEEFYDDAYFKYMQTLPEYAPYSVALPFNDATFQQYDITDFDLAVFVMGDAPLNAQVGSQAVYEKINEMLDGNKNVLLTGRKMLWWAFDEDPNAQIGKNPDVSDLLHNTLGIDYIKDQKVHKREGNTITWWGYFIRGHFGDPIGRNIVKFCNMNFDTGSEEWEPLAHYFSLNVFRSRDPEIFPQVDHFLREKNGEKNDTIAGIRTEIDQARAAVWSVGFEAFAGDVPRETLMQRAMMWLLGNIAPDGAQIQVEPYSTNYGSVPVGETSVREFSINSFGKEDLEINEISFFINDDDAFEVIEGAPEEGETIVVPPGEYHLIKVAFTPESEKRYEGLLTIKSNAINAAYKDVNIEGTGGPSEQGPMIETNAVDNTLDFGSIKSGKSNDLELEIMNSGDGQMRVDDLELIENSESAFMFPQTFSTPFFVLPDEKYTIKVRFIGLAEEKEYTAKLLIESDAHNHSDLYIDLIGVVDNSTSVFDDHEEIKYLEVKAVPNPADDGFRLEMINTSNMPVPVSMYLMNSNGEKVRTFDKNTIETGMSSFWVPSGELSSGKYYIVIKSGNMTDSYPLLINK